ncbi:MinD/ParA family ATP-binding protein [Pimelobacter simplex]|uniref:MinD/ParA family ATP-binding protein n=1 Tax=Nocardioides simplex TaxID=2045 RepID=UPI0027DD2F45
MSHSSTDPLTDHLSDPLTDPIGERPAAEPATPPPADEHTAVRGMLAPLGPPPVGPPPMSPPPSVALPPAVPAPAAEPRRFMTATDFLDRRDNHSTLGPATWGWRGRVRRWTGGLVKPAMGAAERSYEADRAAIQKDFDGPRTIAFVNPKGGAAKTTGVLAAGYTFGTVRGGGVIAWDNNETRGTLGIRGTRGAHRNTTRELLEDLERFTDVYQSRIGDLGAFVRSQGDAHFDVLASDERPDVTGVIHADDFAAVHALLERFYRILLIDTGNNLRAENWLAAAGAADLLVVTSTVREDTGYSGLWMLDALQDAGHENLKYKTITVLSDPSPKVDEALARDLVQVYEQRTRGVYRVPYDPALVSGSVVPYSQLSAGTRRSWLRACAAMATAL